MDDSLLPISIREQWPWQPRFARVNSWRMHYVDEGTGDPVVLLHGNMRPLYQPVIEGDEYHHYCHSNLTRALAMERKVHDVMKRFHVHWVYARHASVFHESKPGSARRFHRVFRRD
jgi:hypothetical protein